MAVYPHLLPLPIAIVLAITGAVLVLILGILYTICFRCPVCGLLLYGKLTPFQEPSQCPFCGADLDDDVPKYKPIFQDFLHFSLDQPVKNEFSPA